MQFKNCDDRTQRSTVLKMADLHHQHHPHLAGCFSVQLTAARRGTLPEETLAVLGQRIAQRAHLLKAASIVGLLLLVALNSSRKTSAECTVSSMITNTR